MTLDLDELERKAKAVLSATPTAYAGICAKEDWHDAVSPSVVLALIERVRKAETALRSIRDDGLSRDDARDEARKALNA